MNESIAFARAINAAPCDRAPQLIYADWLDERGDRRGNLWRNGFDFLGRGRGRGLGLGRGRGRGLGLGLGLGLGRGLGRGLGLGLGLGLGRGRIVDSILNPEGQVVLIPGENALILIPNDYGFSLLVGHVAQELAHGWIVDPCREILEIPNEECIADLVGDEKGVRKQCRFGKAIKGGARVPFGVASLPWSGKLPE